MIKGKNIDLRLVTDHDLEYLYAVMNDLSNTNEFWPLMLETRKTFMDKFAQTGFWGDQSGKMLIVDKNDNILGEMNYFKGLWYMPGYEVGYRIYRPEDRGKGTASKALALFIDFLFKSKEINRLEIEADVDNVASIRIAEKCGFKREGIKKQSAYVNGRYRDNLLLALLREEYFTKPINNH